MAYVPDEAIDDSYLLAPSAFRLYSLLCRRRDHKDGLSRLKPVRGMESLRLKKSQFFDAKKQLIKEGWVRLFSEDEFELLKGDFSPVNSEKSESEKSDTPKNRILNSEKSESNTPKNRTPNSEKSESLLKEYPASLSSTIDPAHTSNTKRAVCAGNNGSIFSLDECYRYVQLCVSKGEIIKNPKGLATSLFQSGQSDAFIQATLYPETDGSPEPTEDDSRQTALEFLQGIQADGLEVKDFKQFHSEDDWLWLTAQLQTETN